MQTFCRRRSMFAMAVAAGVSGSLWTNDRADAQQSPTDPTVLQIASDAPSAISTSFNKGVNFNASSNYVAGVSGIAADTTPTAGYAYVDQAYELRTPASTTLSNYTFGGDSLTLIPSSPVAALDNPDTGIGSNTTAQAYLDLKGATAATTIHINNLVLANGGSVRNLGNDNQTLAGNIYLVPDGVSLDGLTTSVNGGIIDTFGNSGSGYNAGVGGTNENYFTISANISGGGMLRIVNTGGSPSVAQVLILSGNNTFSGGVVLDNTSTFSSGNASNSPDLAIDSLNALGSGPLTILSGTGNSFLLYSPNTGPTIDNLTGSAEVLSTTNAQFWNGNFVFAGSSSLEMGGAVTLGANVTVDVAKNTLKEDGAVSSSSSGSFGLTKAGAGTLYLNGALSYSGATAVSGGVLEVPSPAFTFPGGLSVSSGATIALAVGGAGQFANSDVTNFLNNFSGSFAYSSLLGIDTTSAAGGFTIPDNLNGNFGINKIGSNTLTLTGSNNLGGPIIVAGGTLVLSNNTFLSSSAGANISSGATLNLNGASQIIQNITGSGTITNTSASTANIELISTSSAAFAGTLTNGTGDSTSLTLFLANSGSVYTLTGSNTYSGPTTLQSGILNIGGAHALSNASGSTVVFNGGTLQFSSAYTGDPSPLFNTSSGQQYNLDTNGQNINFSTGLTSSGGSLNKLGSGILVLRGISNIGSAVVSAGTLELAAEGASYGSITVDSGATLALAVLGINSNGVSQLNAIDVTNIINTTNFVTGSALGIDTTGGSFILGNNLNGSYGLTKLGPNTLTLTGTDSLSGPITVSAGTLVLDSSTMLSPSYPMNLGVGATLDLGGVSATVPVLNGSAGSSIINSGAAATLTVGSSGTASSFAGNISTGIALTSTSGLLTLSGTNSYTGNTTLDPGGTLNFNSSGALSPSTKVVFAGGNFQFSSNYTADPSAQFSTSANQAFNLDTNGQNINLSTGLSSTNGTLNKFGAGTLTLLGHSSYSGITTVAAGTLKLGVANALNASSALAFGGTGANTFDLGGYSDTTPSLSSFDTGSIITNSGSSNSLLTVSQAAGTSTYFGAIKDGPTNTVGVLYNGTGNQVLYGSSNYSAGTAINSGTVTAGSNTALGSGGVTLGGGTLSLALPLITVSPVISGISSSNFTVNAAANAGVGHGISGSTLTLTDNQTPNGQDTSAFTNTPVTLGPIGFFASFQYTVTARTPGPNFTADGMTFTLQNDPKGPSAIGSGASLFGYGGIQNSAAVATNIYDYSTTGETPGVAFGTDGATPTTFNDSDPDLDTLEYNAVSSPVTFNITLSYNPSLQSLTETINSSSGTYSETYAGVNYTTILGSNSAYLGFTGSTGFDYAGQAISNFNFGNYVISGVSGPARIANNVTAAPSTSSVISLGVASGNVSGGIGSLNIGSGAIVKIVAASADGIGTHGVLTTTGLTISGAADNWTGTLDLTNNALDVQNGNLATITDQLKQGYSNGTWQGSGGIISSTAASAPTHLTALGVILNTANGSTPLYGSSGALGLFDGISPAATDVLIKYTYYGDTNLDGKVDGSDYARIDNGYLASLSGWYNGDFNYDGIINGSDYTLVDNAFNTQGASLAGSIAFTPTAQIAAADGSAVPEPNAMAMLGIAAFGLIGRRRHRSLPAFRRSILAGGSPND